MFPVEVDAVLRERLAQNRIRLAARVALEDVLSETQRRAVILRYGLDDGEEKSTWKIADLEGVSEVAIRARLEKALRSLRRSPYGKILLLGLYSLE